MNKTGPRPLYHVTLLSNFSRAFDKYRRVYSKAAIPESTYPGEFYLLPREALQVGVDKASGLLARVGLPGDALLALETCPPTDALRPHPRGGIGQVWPSGELPIAGLHRITDGMLSAHWSIEDAMAESLALHATEFRPYALIQPRSLSFLPVAHGCDAACPFCFSDASASADQRQAVPDWALVERWIEAAAARGAQRAVITGGGEPTLLRWRELLRLVRACATAFAKVVLISNGARLAKLPAEELATRLRELDEAGLSILAVSRHHADEEVNRGLMKLGTDTPQLMRALAAQRASLQRLRPRLICVLQRGGIDNAAGIARYLEWAAAEGVGDVCFKELYVSTSRESLYHSHQANAWSAAHQVPLSMVHEWAQSAGFAVTGRLPWGAPIYGGSIGGQTMRVAAYTEPSLFWERRNGLARSWNVMADGTCLASLEDRNSVVTAAAETA